MTTEVRTFGNTAGNNNVTGALFAEGLLGNLLTDNIRQLQAAMRNYANQAEWFSIGDLTGPATFTFLTTESFRVQGASLADRYHEGRRVRATGTATGTITGTISSVTINGGSTDVTVNWDGSGALSSESLLIELGVNSAVGSSIPGSIDHAMAIIGALTLTGALNMTGNLSVDGLASFTGNISAPLLTTTNGPFTLDSFGKGESGSSTIAVPATAKRGLLTIYGAGGGGSSSPETFSGSVNKGDDGTTLSLSTDPSGQLTITVPGGIGGGADTDNVDGKDAATADGVSVAGTAVLASINAVNLGSPGGAGANFGSSGIAGSFCKVLFDATDIDEINTTGGQGGSGANKSGASDGGNGGRAQTLVEFYK